MSPRNRALLRWLFILTFLVIAPVIILSTAGYRFNFGTHRLVRTGVIIVDTTPSGASIWLNGRLQSSTAPARIAHVLPGDVDIRVAKQGYRDWEKTLAVEEGQTLFLNDIALFPDALPVIEREEAGIKASALSRDGRFAAEASNQRGATEVRIFDFKSGDDRLVQRTSSATDSVALSWSADGRRLLIGHRGSRPTFELWDADSPSGLTDFISLLPDAPSSVFWGNDGQALFAADATTLYEIDLAARVAQATGPSAAAMTVTHDVVYGLEGSGVVRRRLSAGTFEPIASLPDGRWSPLESAGALPGFVSDDGRLELVDPAARNVAFEGRGRDGSWSTDGRRLAYWDDFELRIFDAQAHADDLVTRISSPIVGAVWVSGDRAILYAAGGTLAAIESGHAGSRLVTPIAAFDAISDLAAPAGAESAWIVGTIGHATGIFSLKLK